MGLESECVAAARSGWSERLDTLSRKELPDSWNMLAPVMQGKFVSYEKLQY